MADRRLLAIMFSDVVGYSSSMAASEHAAMDILSRNRSLIREFVSAYGGTFRKEIGDGTFSSFPSAIEAVACAIEIQAAMAAQPDFRIRIGIHVGDVIEEDGDVFGDGVNIASRLEPQAPPGGIYVSAQEAELLRNKPFISFSSLGEHALKGVGASMPLFSVSADTSTPDFAELRQELASRRTTAGKPAKPEKPPRPRRAVAIAAAGVVVLVAGEPHAYLVWLLEKTGAHDEALRMYGEMKAGTKKTYVSPFLFAIAETGLGRYDDAMESLRRSISERDTNFAYEIRDRALSPLHSRDEWKDLMAKVGLPP